MVSKPSKKNSQLPTFFLILLSLSLILIFLHIFQSQNEVSIKTHQNVGKKYPRWYEVIAHELGKRRIRVGLVNININEANESMIGLVHGEAAGIVKVDFDPVCDHVKWDDLFPEWIDEAIPQEQKCPEIPMPSPEDYGEFDVVVAHVPCPQGGEKGLGSRDVFRLQVNLVVAQLLARGHDREWEYYKENKMKYVVFMGSCGPMWEIFRCDDLLWHEGIWSIYRPALRKLKQKVLMPVGSCQLAHPFAESGQEVWQRFPINSSSFHKPREAYATILHSSEAYVCGAIALAQSIIQSKSTRELVLLADDSISRHSLQGLEAAGWKIKRIKRIRSPRAKKDAYNEWNYTKLRLWQLTEYDKVIFIDSDLIVLRNLDGFFLYPQLSAAGNDGHIFNSGVMIVEPSRCAFQTLMRERYTTASYNGGDQGFLNEMFTWWHRWPRAVNFLKIFSDAKDFSRSSKISKDLYTIHYLGLKPWMCYQDYDCNWDKEGYQRYGCDLAHQKWWQVYNAMPKKLRTHCDLTPTMDARIREWRERARNANFNDGHWKIN